MKSTRPLLTALLAAALSVCLLLPARADFSDVPPEHWAYAYVLRAEEAGAVNGVGGGLFDPESSVTEAQFYAMLLRTLSDVSLEGYDPGTVWYDVYLAAAADTDLSDGVYALSPDTPLTRYQMAQVMFNLVRGPRDDGPAAEVLASIPDGTAVPEGYRYAVAFVYSAGLIRGMDKAGSFLGDLPMTRAQAAAVWCRLADYLAEFGANDEITDNPPPFPAEDPLPELPGPADPGSETVTAPGEDAGGVMTVNGTDYRVGMTEEDLTALAGEPDEILGAFGGFRWYVFGTGDYERSFFAAGVTEGRVVLLLSAGKAFSVDYLGAPQTWGSGIGGLPHGSLAETVTEEGAADSTTLFFDKNNGYALYMALTAEKQYLRIPFYAGTFHVTAEECEGEARLILHLVNATRAGYGIRPMAWDPAAAEAARLHAEDMTRLDYFSHQSADGRSMTDRLEEAGAGSWSACGENIAKGYWGAVEVHACWIGSPGHRENLLSDEYTRFGAGISVSGTVTNYVEDFYTRMGE